MQMIVALIQKESEQTQGRKVRQKLALLQLLASPWAAYFHLDF